ncbi:hypothetical protein C8J56DRAFT_768378 [Mycena floridula]|nr:hypothetical protein C8J56DRAFT_768378 [Mycena floridula]
MGCKQPIKPPKKVSQCSVCKAVVYCSKKCQKQDWNVGSIPGSPSHKILCPDNKRHMERIAETQTILLNFKPWGRIEKDGSFSLDIARGRFRVLGGSGYGFWSHRGGPVPHQDAGAGGLGAYIDPEMAEFIKAFSYLDGKDLLEKKQLSDKEGWKLVSELIPFRDFSQAEAKRPVLVTDFDHPIKDWVAWYKWRQLPLESPAALLMDFPMSVYQLLVHVLHVTSPDADRGRVPLHFHLLGVEMELNFLPLFSELALLLPNHDIKMVLFGHGVEKLITEAKKHPNSLVAKASNTNPIFAYDAPPECGSGKISIYIYRASPTWHPRDQLGSSSPFGTPDALIACNAGLGSYQGWHPVIQAAHQIKIPFGVTEYAEQSCETQRSNFPLILSWAGIPTRKLEEYKIELNPFAKPGNRSVVTYKVPNLYNGFTLVVYSNAKKKSPPKVIKSDRITRVMKLMYWIDRRLKTSFVYSI